MPRKRKSGLRDGQKDEGTNTRKPVSVEDTEQDEFLREIQTNIELGPSLEADTECTSPSLDGRRAHESDSGEAVTDGDMEADAMGLKVVKEQQFARAGILESVQLDRFMSHKCFKYEFGPNVNIIHGANGSGKSAIVAALQIGLGAKAKDTERGVQIRDHIMHGNNSAVITIRIHNRKPEGSVNEQDTTFRYEREVDGKQPELIYGPKIIIERRILRSGVSYWAVKNWLGNPVDTEGLQARTEVRNIVDHFGFMVENPVTFLTQAKSRAFLGTLRPSRLYALYREATLVGAIENELSAILKSTDDVKLNLEEKMKFFNEVENSMHDLEAELTRTKAMKTINMELADAEVLYAWTAVEEVDHVLKDWERRITQDFEPNAKRAQIAYSNAVQKVYQVSNSVADVQTKLRSSAEGWKLAEEIMGNRKREELSCRRELEHHQRLVVEYECEIREGKQSIAATKDSLKSASLEALTGKEMEDQVRLRLEEVTKLMSRLEKAVSEAECNGATAHESVYSAADNARKAQGDLDMIRIEFEHKRREFEQQKIVSRGSANTVQNLMERINSKRIYFQEAPIGPLSQYIKVLDEQWVGTAEFCIGTHTLQSFVVHSTRDASVLQELLPDHPRPNIFVSSLRRTRYSISETDLPQINHFKYQTMLDILEIDNDAVFNVLVDERSVDRIVLVGDEDDITEIGWSRVPNVVEVCNADGHRAYERNGSNVFRKSKDHKRIGRGILTTDCARYRRSLEHERDALRGKLLHQQALVIRTENIAKEAQAQIAPAKHAVRTLQKELNEVCQKKSEIEYQLSRINAAFDPKPFENEILRLEIVVAEAQKRLEAKRAYISNLMRKLKDLNDACHQAVKVVQEKKDEQMKLTDELEIVDGALAEEKSSLREKKTIEEKATQRLREAQAEIRRKRAERANNVAHAMQLGERPTTTNAKKNSTTKISGMLSRLRDRLNEEQERGRSKSVEEIAMEHFRTKKKYREMEKLLRRITFYQKSLEKGGPARITQSQKLERGLRTGVRSKFLQVLQTRGYEGKMIIRKNERGENELLFRLKMASHKRGDGEDHETKDLRSLSGGERSFVTLAFILALAEATQNPIRVMDEIDVFQDSANRAASLQTFVEYCSSSLPDKQFIIITPSTISGIRPSASVRIVRLDPPQR